MNAKANATNTNEVTCIDERRWHRQDQSSMWSMYRPVQNVCLSGRRFEDRDDDFSALQALLKRYVGIDFSRYC